MAIKKCRVCGKDYTVCKNAAHNTNNKTFRWQEVACSPECGSEYFRLIAESRTQAATQTKVENTYISDDYDEDEDFDEDVVESLFDDSEPSDFDYE